MKITAKDTVGDVILKNAALFKLGAGRIAAQLDKRPAPEYVTMRRRWRFDKSLPVRNVDLITMGELDAIQQQPLTYEHFERVLGVMLGFVRFNKTKNGEPMWEDGFEVDSEKIRNLRFIRAFRYYIEIQKQLQRVAKKWKTLEMPKGKKKPSKVKRHYYGLHSICQEFCNMIHSYKIEDVWNIKWVVVFTRFQKMKEDNMQQRAEHEVWEAEMRRRNTSIKHRR